MRVIRYPPQDGIVDERVIGIGAHTECVSLSRPKFSSLIFERFFCQLRCKPVLDAENSAANWDIQSFTVLWQEPGVEALQVLNANKEWVTASPIPGTLVIKWATWYFLLTLYGSFEIHTIVLARNSLAGQVGISMPIWCGLSSIAIVDDVFRSTVHRAINRNGILRHSMPVFVSADHDALLEVRDHDTCGFSSN